MTLYSNENPDYSLVLSRHQINQNIIFHQHDDDDGSYVRSFDYNDMCGMIDFWKMFLVEKYNAQPGQLLYIASSPRYYYYTLVLAAAELGLVLLLDWPHVYSESDLSNYKINMWGQIDFVIVEKKRAELYNKWEIEKFHKFSKNFLFLEDIENYKIQNPELFKKVSKRINTDPDSILISYASSGTTGDPKKIKNSHKKICLISNRMKEILGFFPDQKILHANNLHHGASLCYHWLPGLMSCDEHYTIPLSTIVQPKEYTPFILENKINRIYLFTHDMLITWLRNVPRLDVDVDVTTIFQITPECLRLIKEKNVKSVTSIFGSTDVDPGILTKIVTSATDESTFDVTNMGPQRGDFFQIEVRDNLIYVACPALDEDWRTTGDQFELIDNEFYFKGRANRYRINDEWFTLNEIESKVFELFGSSANIVVDFDMQKIYLAAWEEIPAAEKQLDDFFKTRFTSVTISYVLRNEDYAHYFNSRKIDNSKIRDRVRSLLNLN